MMQHVHPSRRPAFLAAIVVSAALCLNACSRTPASLKRPNMTALSPRLQPLFEKTRTVCFGRFVVEVPATATVVYGPGGVDGGLIVHYPGEAGKLAQHVTEQIVEVEKDRDFLDKDDLAKFPLFGKATDGAMPGQKLVFGSRDHVSYSIDSYIPLGNDLFVQRAVSAVSKDKSIASLNSVARLLRLRAENEVPTESGICIDGGFLPGQQPEYENVALGIRLKEFPDVHFSVEVKKNQDFVIESSALEPLLKQAEKDGGSWYSGIKFFRRGPRQLGHWNGFEVLAHKPPQEKSTDSHEFLFHSLGAPKDPLHPSLDIQLDTGVKKDSTASIKPSLTDEEAVALWDKLTTSIRVRPTGGAKHSAVEPPKTPLGTLVATGNACPHAGWWQCAEGGDVAGGTRQHFKAGEALPHAVLLGKPTAWQKLKGERPSFKTATVWKLVEFDAAATPAAGPATLPPSDVAQMTPAAAAEDPTPPGEG
jgi:hypothetical protein